MKKIIIIIYIIIFYEPNNSLHVVLMYRETKAECAMWNKYNDSEHQGIASFHRNMNLAVKKKKLQQKTIIIILMIFIFFFNYLIIFFFLI